MAPNCGFLVELSGQNLPEGSFGRTDELAPRTAWAIDLAIGERTEGPMLLARDGRRLDRHAAGRIVRRTARRARIARLITPYTLRHEFITAALDAGHAATATYHTARPGDMSAGAAGRRR